MTRADNFISNYFVPKRKRNVVNSRSLMRKKIEGSEVFEKRFHVSESFEDSKRWFKNQILAQIERGGLFEDPFMPTNDNTINPNSGSPPAIGFSSAAGPGPSSANSGQPYKWLRPKELMSKPLFISDGISRFDVKQGELGDCWLLAALSSLSMHENLFNQVVPPDQNFENGPNDSLPYVGMFWFRLWHFGDWIDIVVDDRLPTKNGRLVFLHSTDRVEFWSALIEKAYAKLVGSYEALRGGSTAEAMEDFTGGLTEMVELGKKAPTNLFDIMDRAHARCSLMACSIDAAPDEIEAEGPHGLIMGHAYSITDVKLIRDSAPNTKIRMIRLRNPWGNEREWSGPWSDKSDEWNRISAEERRRIGLTFDSDGEFWMAYKDFIEFFSRLELCHLGPESDTLSAVSQSQRESVKNCPDKSISNNNNNNNNNNNGLLTSGSKHKRRWEMSKHEGEWLRNATAGGCRNFIETFHMNPQFHVTVESPEETTDRPTGTLIIGLMQKEMRELRREPYTIGYSIYHLPENHKRGALLDQRFFRTHASAARSPVFINMREVCGRHELKPGDYVIIPSTFSANEVAKFMLRIFSEKACESQELDDVTRIADASLPTAPLVLVQDEDSMQRLKAAFKVIAGPSGDISTDELCDILNEAFARDFPFPGFSRETARSMIALMDTDLNGRLGFEEFKRLWIELRLWKTIFKKFDHDRSGTLNAFELRTVMSNIGFHVSNDIYKAIACRYANRSGQILFDDYVLLLVRLMTVFETFKAQERLPDGRAVFEAEDFIRAVIYI